MGKTAFLFAGQGAQYIGMGRSLYETYPVCKHTFEEAGDTLGRDLTKLIFDGEKKSLNLTENTQPSIVTVSLAAFRAAKEKGIRPDVVAGLSLGEYSALTAAGVFTLCQTVQLVCKRGQFMQEAVPEGKGTMFAILGLSSEKVREVCESVQELGIAEPSNFNCPGQIVIGGEKKAVEEAARLAKEKGAVKTIELSVSAPFHTSMLKPAAEKLKQELRPLTLGSFSVPLVNNVEAEYVTDAGRVKELLYRQVMSSVLWEQSIRRMLAEGVTAFVEIGPGKALSGFVRKIDRKVKVCNIEDDLSLEKAVEIISGAQ